MLVHGSTFTQVAAYPIRIFGAFEGIFGVQEFVDFRGVKREIGYFAGLHVPRRGNGLLD